MKAQYDSYKARGPICHWQPGTDGYDSGVILLPEGVVEVMMQGDDGHYALTRLDTVLDGRHVMYTVRKRYSRKGVIGLARQLLKRQLREENSK